MDSQKTITDLKTGDKVYRYTGVGYCDEWGTVLGIEGNQLYVQSEAGSEHRFKIDYNSAGGSYYANSVPRGEITIWSSKQEALDNGDRQSLLIRLNKAFDPSSSSLTVDQLRRVNSIVNE